MLNILLLDAKLDYTQRDYLLDVAPVRDYSPVRDYTPVRDYSSTHAVNSTHSLPPTHTVTTAAALASAELDYNLSLQEMDRQDPLPSYHSPTTSYYDSPRSYQPGMFMSGNPGIYHYSAKS